MIKYKISSDDYLAAQRLHQGTKRWIYVAVVIFVTTLLSFRIGISADGRINWLVVVIPIIMITAGMVYGTTIGEKRKLALRYKEHKALQNDVQMDFDAVGICWNSVRGTFTLPWNDIYKVKESPELIVVFQTSTLMHVVPKRAFTDQVLLEQFVHYLKMRGEPSTPTDGAAPSR